MSAIQKVTPYIEQFQRKIREAKESHHLTIEQLSEQSGVPASVVGRISSGAHPDPKLINAAALCDVLGLSLDELCGLAPAAQSDEALLARVHELEMKEAGKDGQILELHDRLKAILPLVYGLCAMCIVLAMCLAVYLLGDAQYPDIGLIQWGEISAPAWTLIGIIVLSVGTTALLVYRVTHSRKEIKDE